MPITMFGTNDKVTQKVWTKKTWLYAMNNSFFFKKGMLGQEASSIIQMVDDLQKSRGDRITVHLVNPLVGNGQGDNGTLRGNAEAQGIGTFDVEVHSRMHSVSCGDDISEQRTVMDLRSTGRDNLGTWQSEIWENDVINALSGLYNVGSNIQTVNVHEPTSSRILYIGQTTAGVVVSYTTDALLSAATTTDALFGTKIVEIAKRKAKRATPRIRPIIVDGKEYYVMLISSLQAKALRSDTAWIANQQSAALRGLDNPIFSGALGIHDGVILHEYDRIQSRTGDATGTAPSNAFRLNAGLTAPYSADYVIANTKTVDRALLLGAQAGAWAWAKKPTWKEDYEDVADGQPIIATRMIYGIGKTVFNAPGTTTATQDYGVIAVDTQVVAD